MISIIGDFHIPERASEITPKFVPLLKESELILCTGDLIDPRVLEELKTYSEVKAVKGNMDYIDLPGELVFEVRGIKFGLFHGRGIYPRGDREKLAQKAIDLGVQVLVSGHTHKLMAEKFGTVILLNPGSATGAESGEGVIPKPTFLTIEIVGGGDKSPTPGRFLTIEPERKALNITAYTLDTRLVGRKHSLQI